MLTEKDHCDYETCVALKELGIPRRLVQYVIPEDRDRIHLWNAQKWLREEKNAIVVVYPYTYNIVDETHTWTSEVWFGDNLEIELHDLHSYEEALSEGVKCAVKILKEK